MATAAPGRSAGGSGTDACVTVGTIDGATAGSAGTSSVGLASRSDLILLRDLALRAAARGSFGRGVVRGSGAIPGCCNGITLSVGSVISAPSFPEVIDAGRAELAVADRVLDGPVAQIVLQRP